VADDDEIRLDWSAASVDGGRLTVPLAGKTSAHFKADLTAVIARLQGGGSAWGEIKVGKAKVRVDGVAAGDESDLRHFLESAVLQANANARADEEDDDERSADERSESDQQLTDAFRAFAEEPPG
jgi:hypothetical protein